MHLIQQFMREHIYAEPTGKCTILTPIIKTKFPDTSNFSVQDCQSCILYRSKKRYTGTTNVKPLPENSGP